MPNSTEEEDQRVGLSFGNFTAEECGKYFGEQVVNRGVYPPVEFEYSDGEEQLTKEFQAKTEVSSEAQNGPTTVPEDSGVEVGQESEQELVNVKTQQTGRSISADVKHESRATGSGKEGDTRSMDEKAVKDGGNIVFGGESIMEKKENSKPYEGSLASPESNGFPPLISSATVASEKQETEKLRKRRKKRRHRQRSGSISSSSSEASEGRSPSSSSDRLSKPKAGHHVVEKLSDTKDAPQGLDVDNPSITAASSSVSNSLSSSHTKSEREGCASKTTENVTENAPTVQQGSRGEGLVEESSPGETKKSANIVGTDVRTTPKPVSWAALFKNSPSPPSIVIKPFTATTLKPESNPALKMQASEEPAQIVPLEEDRHASKLAERVLHAKITNDAKPFCPRGLANKANWCYVNATLQALLACPLFSNLLRGIPVLKERGPTSTPILDSLVRFVHEFEILPKSLASASGKSTFRNGAPFEPVYVYKMLSLIKSCLSFKGRQEDAEEFLSCVLNGLHEEFLQLNKLVSPSSKDGAKAGKTGSDEHEVVVQDWGNSEGNNEEGDWEQVGPRNKSTVTRMASFPKSVISEIFGGYLRSSLHQTGLKESANVEPFFDLQLDIQSVSCIEDALKDLVVKEELQGYTCTKTKQQVDVSRRVTLETLPKVLILHLKRFIYSKTGSQKLQKAIDYPLELTISKELLSSNVKNKYTHAQKVYRLFAVIYHHGKMATGGHYTTDMFHPVYGWLRADDVKLKTVPLNFVLKPAQGKDPYVLFYRRADL